MGKQNKKSRVNYKKAYLESQKEVTEYKDSHDDLLGRNRKLEVELVEEKRRRHDAEVTIKKLSLERHLNKSDGEFGEVMREQGWKSPTVTHTRTVTIDEKIGKLVETVDLLATQLIILDSHVERFTSKVEARVKQISNINNTLKEHL